MSTTHIIIATGLTLTAVNLLGGKSEALTWLDRTLIGVALTILALCLVKIVAMLWH